MNVKAFRAKDALGSPDGFFATVTTDSSQGLDDNHLQIQQVCDIRDLLLRNLFSLIHSEIFSKSVAECPKCISQA